MCDAELGHESAASGSQPLVALGSSFAAFASGRDSGVGRGYLYVFHPNSSPLFFSTL